MGRFHRHDGDEHSHSHDHSLGHSHGHSHDHDHEYLHEHGIPHSHDDGFAYDVNALPDAKSPHGDHTGYQTGPQRVLVLEDIFAENDELAEQNQSDFDRAGVKCVNLMSSPGSGKTEVLVATLKALGKDTRVGIVEGDIETDLDAQRLGGFGAQISVLNTAAGFGGECHLDAPMVAHALEGLKLEDLDLVFIENVGNLVCPAEFEVGAHHKAMVYSITEGEDKPKKYPVMFRSVEVVLVNKIDLLPYLDFDMELFRRNLREVNPGAKVIEVCAKNGDGIGQWIDWLRTDVMAG